VSYETPRPRTDAEPKDLPPFSIVLLFVIVISVALGTTVHAVRTSRAQADESPTITHDSLAPTYTYDGEVIRWYVFVDPDTNVEYLVNDRGGCCPRLDAHGDVMGTLTERGV